jgi:hypothetical protein
MKYKQSTQFNHNFSLIYKNDLFANYAFVELLH